MDIPAEVDGLVVGYAMSGWLYAVALMLAGMCVGLVVMWQLGYDPVASLSCVQQGNTYQSVTLTGENLGKYYCVHQFSDGGQPCASSLECEGECLVSELTVVTTDQYYGKKVEGSGTCQYSDAPVVGCTKGTIENPTTYCQ